MKYLVVVESPSKIKKIQKILNETFPIHTFIVAASVGHITELSKIKKGVDIKNNFKPNWIESKDKKKVIQNLKTLKTQVDKVLLATDLDTEGEKIAYDIAIILKLNFNDKNRLIFNEITTKALKKSFENPITINMNLVHSQFARRILDRLIGFEISGITAKEIQRGCSAGRVLSITTKLIHDREKELLENIGNSNHEIYGNFKNENYELNDTVYQQIYDTEEKLELEMKKLQNSKFTINNIKYTNQCSSPPVPFITSTITQASPYSIRQTTSLLQKLYQKGHITYIRTDSTRMSDSAVNMIRKYIIEKYDKNMYQYRTFNKKIKGAQEAHEAIRPTNISMNMDRISNQQEKNIYKLIWQRSVACLMADSKYILNDILIDVSETEIKFRKKISKYTFLGWKAIYSSMNELNKDAFCIENIQDGDKLDYTYIHSVQRYNSSIGRYTESKLINTLEKLGIGRPSTYSSAVTNIQNKNYVQKGNIKGNDVLSLTVVLKNDKISKRYFNETINSEKNRLLITNLGKKVTKFLDEKFDTIMNYNFTSDIELELDKIQKAEIVWYDTVKTYYNMFHPQVVENKERLKKNKKDKKENSLIGCYKNKNFYRAQTQYGPRVIYGEKKDKDVLYLTPIKNSLLENITIEDAIKLLPHSVGSYKDKDITLHFSRNLYIKYNGSNYPLPWYIANKKKEYITLVDAIYAINEFDKKKKMKGFTVSKLKQIAKEKNITGYTKMKKGELMKVLGIKC